MRGGFVSCVVVMFGLFGCDSQELSPCHSKPWDDEVCIRGGWFTIGHAQVPNAPPACEEYGTCGDAAPSQQAFAPSVKVHLKPFFIDKYPVSVKQYRACVDAGVCEVDCWTTKQCGDGRYWDYRDPALDDFAILGLNYRRAQDYCQWAGKRLVWEAEWERAARGPDSTDYPWGNDPPTCEHYPCDLGTPPFGWSSWISYPVGSIPGDRSPEGVMEMVTNGGDVLADRWISGFTDLDPEAPFRPRASDLDKYVTRFGTFATETYHGMNYPVPAWFRNQSPGFGGTRCARDDVDTKSPRRAITPEYVRKRQEILSGRRVTR